MSLTKCPGCGKYAAPTGETCPDCNFPVSHYVIRKRWLRWAFTGMAALVVWVVLVAIVSLSDLRGWVGWSLRIMGAAGMFALFVGLVGLVFGHPHHHTWNRSRPSSGGQHPA